MKEPVQFGEDPPGGAKLYGVPESEARSQPPPAPGTWRPIRIRFIAGALILTSLVVVTVFAQFFAPYDYREQVKQEPGSPPSVPHFRDTSGGFHLIPVFYPMKLVDPLTRQYAEDATHPTSLVFLAHAWPYKLFGISAQDVHLFGASPANNGGTGPQPRVHLLGTDELGRDRFSRLIIAGRFSLVVGPLGALLAGLTGVLLGCVAGYARRFVDSLLMRIADTMMALPLLVLILAARAAFPVNLSPVQVALLVIGIFVIAGWAEMARLTRGLVLSIRNREYVIAARSLGAGDAATLFRHILPNSFGPIALQFLLTLPAFLLTETSLSFLGIGLQEPEPSWGNMLTAAGDYNLLRNQPVVVLSPAICIFLFIFAVRLISDALREKSD